jgi:hypothetical protein|tara:strand:- start:414 stop:1241 length:828 start_codon:yes stop_codon:yes gene_type:complete
MSKKFQWNPLTDALEDINHPSPHISSADAKKNDPTAGAVYTSNLDQAAYPKIGTSPGEIAAAKKISNEERRKQYLNKAWGLENPKDPSITKEDFQKETPRYRKHLADIIAGDQQTIFYNKDTGDWRDKLDQERKPEEVLKEQQEIQKRYDSIFTPKEQEEYQQSLIKPVQRKRNAFQKKKIENYNKQNRKYPKVNNEMPREEETKQPEASNNSFMINELEQLAKLRLEDQRLEHKFNEIMKPQKDPDMDLGIASVDGVEVFKKTVDLAKSKWRPR